MPTNPEINPPEPGPVDKEAVENESKERDKRRAAESESVLDEEPKKDETMGETGETRVEQNKSKRATEIRKEAEEELRKNPVSLTEGESRRIFQEAEKREAERILSELTEKGKELYPDISAADQAREKMLQRMVDNKVIPEAEKQNFCSREAFFELLKGGYNAQEIKLAGFFETVKAALWGAPIIKQIDFFRKMGEGEMLVMPRINGRKRTISFEDFKREAEELDMELKLKIEGARRYERTKVLAEKEDAEIQKRVIETMEREERMAEQVKGEGSATGTKIEAEADAPESEPEPNPENESAQEKQEKLRRAAILWDRTYKIDKALRRENFDNFKYKKIRKGGEEEIFEGEEAKKQAKKDKNAMSKELMALAQEISGRDFLEDAGKIKKKWPKKELYRYITEQVQLILEGEGIKFVKEKIKRKK